MRRPDSFGGIGLIPRRRKCQSSSALPLSKETRVRYEIQDDGGGAYSQPFLKPALRNPEVR
jgi:hypothetical protein